MKHPTDHPYKDPRIPGRSGRGFRAFSAVALTVIAVVSIFAWIGSAGFRSPWPTYTSYYDEQAEAFRHGQLHLLTPPAADLLLQTDPYDSTSQAWWRRDLSLYHGKYYTYWGPVPALLQAGVKAAFNVQGLIGDQYLAFTFYCVCALAGASLVYGMARQLFPDVPRALSTLGALSVACANPAPYLIATGGVYQGAIAGGQAFLLVGLLFAFVGVSRAGGQAPIEWPLVTAGVGWALALGSRVTLGPCIAILCVFTAAVASIKTPNPWQRAARAAICMGSPVTAVGALLLLYNRLRFDSWFEFGVNKLLTTLPYQTSHEYWYINAYSYLLRPLSLGCVFPFVSAPWGTEAIAAPKGLPIPTGYVTEPIAGMLLAAPSILFTPWALQRGLGVVRDVFTSDPRQRAILHPRARLYLWCVGAFAISGSITSFAWLGLYLASMRYLGDITAGLTLLGVLGGWTLCSGQPARALRRTLATLIVAGACTLTICAGLLLGYEGYNNHFASFNPALHSQITSKLSFCRPQ